MLRLICVLQTPEPDGPLSFGTGVFPVRGRSEYILEINHKLIDLATLGFLPEKKDLAKQFPGPQS